MGSLALILLVVAVFIALVFPVFVIGRRRDLRNPWVAFIPLLGVWIVLFEAVDKSGWYSLLAFVPYVGTLVLLIWTAVELPSNHGRSRWWTLLLMIPGVNLVGYWFYAFTLPRKNVSFA
jgi:uncharacterized membrane protein YhaH (DUF805 family)